MNAAEIEHDFREVARVFDDGLEMIRQKREKIDAALASLSARAPEQGGEMREALKGILGKIDAATDGILDDWSDPRSDCREIWRLTAEARALLARESAEPAEVSVGSLWNYDRSLDHARWTAPLKIVAIVDGVNEKAAVFDQPMPYKSYGLSYFGRANSPFTPYKPAEERGPEVGR